MDSVTEDSGVTTHGVCVARLVRPGMCVGIAGADDWREVLSVHRPPPPGLISIAFNDGSRLEASACKWLNVRDVLHDYDD